MLKKPKIILFDVETSHDIVANFGLRAEYINHENILQDWFMICAAWKEHGKSRVYTTAVTDFENFDTDPTDDYGVVYTLREMLLTADVLVAHNGDNFDLKKLNARIIYHGMEPLPPITTVDTLKEARKIAKFTSNRLDYLARFLGGTGKIKTSSGLWLRVLRGDTDAIREMVKYNKGDVLELEFVYDKLRPYMKSHPNMVQIAGKVGVACTCCTSENFQQRGYAVTKTQRYPRYQCQDCGTWFRGRQSLSFPLEVTK